MPARPDYKPGPDDLGWWVDPADPPHLTLYREQSVFAEMEDVSPERFTASPVGDVDQAVLQSMRNAMAADGIGEGSMELRYIEQVAFGKIIPWLRQLIGSCVASGAFRCLATRSLIDILLLGDPEDRLGDNFVGQDNLAPFAPYHYGWSRHYAGIGGYRDGSTCSGLVKALMSKGFLPCNTPGIITDAFPEPQNKNTYRDYGAGKHIRQFEAAGSKFDLIESERITSGDQLRSKITEEFKPCMNCSGWALKPKSKHKDGFTIYVRDTSNSWPHFLAKTGIRVASDGNIFVREDNTWGENAHRDGSYMYVPLEVEDQWLRQSECRSCGDLRLREQSDALPWDWEEGL